MTAKQVLERIGAFIGFYLLSVVLWLIPTTSLLALILLRTPVVAAPIWALLWLCRLPTVNRALTRLAGRELPPRAVTVAMVCVAVVGVGLPILSLRVMEADIAAAGFASRDEYFAARAVGANNGQAYRVYQEKLAAQAARAAEDARLRQAKADALDAAAERLVVGRWVLPIDKAGEIVTIRHKGSGYEVLVQYEQGLSEIHPVTKSGSRYTVADDWHTYYHVLADGRMQVGDKKGPDEIFEIVHRRPRDAASVDATIQAAYDAVMTAREAEHCREDASCWSDKNRTPALGLCVYLIEHSARYDLRWTDGWGEEKFAPGAVWHGRTGKALGIVDYYGDKLQLQNGFGAWQNVIYSCTVDTKTGVPLGIQSQPGRLP